MKETTGKNGGVGFEEKYGERSRKLIKETNYFFYKSQINIKTNAD